MDFGEIKKGLLLGLAGVFETWSRRIRSTVSPPIPDQPPAKTGGAQGTVPDEREPPESPPSASFGQAPSEGRTPASHTLPRGTQSESTAADGDPHAAGPPQHWLELVDTGPPAHWLQMVRRRAPQLLDETLAENDDAVAAAPPEGPAAGQVGTQGDSEQQPDEPAKNRRKTGAERSPPAGKHIPLVELHTGPPRKSGQPGPNTYHSPADSGAQPRHDQTGASKKTSRVREMASLVSPPDAATPRGLGTGERDARRQVEGHDPSRAAFPATSGARAEEPSETRRDEQAATKSGAAFDPSSLAESGPDRNTSTRTRGERCAENLAPRSALNQDTDEVAATAPRSEGEPVQHTTRRAGTGSDRPRRNSISTCARPAEVPPEEHPGATIETAAEAAAGTEADRQAVYSAPTVFSEPRDLPPDPRATDSRPSLPREDSVDAAAPANDTAHRHAPDTTWSRIVPPPEEGFADSRTKRFTAACGAAESIQQLHQAGVPHNRRASPSTIDRHLTDQFPNDRHSSNRHLGDNPFSNPFADSPVRAVAGDDPWPALPEPGPTASGSGLDLEADARLFELLEERARLDRLRAEQEARRWNG